MRVLVTGGAGFIGSRYVRRVLNGEYPAFADATVVVLDKLTYAGNLDNLTEVLTHPRMEFVHGDVCDPDEAAAAMSGADTVVHFAAESHVDRSIEVSGGFARTNFLGTQVLLETALTVGVRKFVHVSTDEVYGSVEHGHSRETDALRPNSPYSASKAASDLLACSFHRTHGLPVCITRCSNNYGPNQYPEKIIPLFVTSLLDGRPVPVYGNGTNVRDWLHVDDHCDGVQLVAEKGAPGEIYNIGGGTELTNMELTGHLLAQLGADWSNVVRVADRPGHDQRYSVDSTKIRQQLGHCPKIPFFEGIRDTVEWYRENREWWEARLRRSYDFSEFEKARS
ncbi:dTDP-glucose 4,6-dehydratase [Actinopolyspora mortivallis]|uniref:dTDP-glucose 4,6-dehydratase n=1 Tax=Actinopolyspora mortivallis TaxID=33906 RepID=A0A2T0GSB0_ACTMO|nr:dTDP-glucose 4,6-dehydratase [Actinopolyspora mortivallis]PRW61984.1 dTDP-glucose 4,6-dehydratase [Actinopolyspora mortivallis]